MAKNSFNKGDVVVLKSGGPPMTVDKLPGETFIRKVDSEYYCSWFKGATLNEGSFPEHVLMTYVPPEKK
ncbi:YodC family protein [Enterovirga rhinocerotis]|uniref:Uncharacterized protein YodC (DUF2158 family) n=1 Tax=Enterovirga rhinocerotis TaxID=1339210 RepID=A0A4R7BYK2_9HYPH|nr:DUF2158 domain-containing protein [Enterovirga rhinocerotis]TDR89106.1 uncharacterized protein YodC (DUF2158 family) [Enterovirga rhinocerotis]